MAAGCGRWDPGLRGDEDRATFGTSQSCWFDCPWLRGFAQGGHYAIPVHVDSCSGWSVEVSGVVEDVEVIVGAEADPSGGTEPDPCSGEVRFSAPAEGPFEIAIVSESGELRDHVDLYVAAPDEVFILPWNVPFGWSRLDPERVTIELGEARNLVPLARRDATALTVDPALVSWSVEGDALVDDGPNAYGSGIYVRADAVGVGVVRATLGDVSGQLEIEVE